LDIANRVQVTCKMLIQATRDIYQIIKTGDITELDLWVQDGLDFQQRDEIMGKTPLHQATEFGQGK
jgi:hypothetical protein